MFDWLKESRLGYDSPPVITIYSAYKRKERKEYKVETYDTLIPHSYPKSVAYIRELYV
jgi:hypothetical protein